MTPDDIAAIRRGYLSYSGYPTPDIAELCDSLQAAWIRADDLAQSLEGETRRVDRERERTERAEAEELLARNAVADAMQHIDELYAALARVRALCEPIAEADALMLASRVLAAIDGDNK